MPRVAVKAEPPFRKLDAICERFGHEVSDDLTSCGGASTPLGTNDAVLPVVAVERSSPLKFELEGFSNASL